MNGIDAALRFFGEPSDDPIAAGMLDSFDWQELRDFADDAIRHGRSLRSEMAVLREQRAAAKSIPLVDVIAAALCDQEETAEKHGDEPWWGNGTDYTAQITAEAVRSSIVAALEEPR